MSEHPVTPTAPAGDPRLNYAYYPGCTLHSTAEEFDRSTRFCADRLGMTLSEVPDWICCGSTPAHIRKIAEVVKNVKKR